MLVETIVHTTANMRASARASECSITSTSGRKAAAMPPLPTPHRGMTWRRKRFCSAQAQNHDDRDSPPLVVAGSVNADMVLQIERLPEEGETLAATTLQTFPGGKGANQAAAAGKLGYKTILLGQLGADNNADFLQNSLKDAGVDTSYLKKVSGPSGAAVILLQPSGENSIIIVGGANTVEWNIDEQSQKIIRSAGAILLQREIPETANIQVAKRGVNQVASGANVPVILDCGGVEQPISPELLQNVSVLSPNETELARLTGKPASSKEEVEAAARQLLSLGVKDKVLVKRGGQGSLLVTRDSSMEQSIVKADTVKDTTGAGDCFTGAYAVALLRGLNEKQALQFAAAAASICVQREGAMTSLPSAQEVDNLLQG